jgi:hypothetical protein
MVDFTRKWLFAAFVLAIVGGCAGVDSPSDYEPLVEVVAGADSVVLYEGLPHQDGERKLFEQELAEKENIEIRGFRFYEKKLPLTDEDIETLREVFTTTETFRKRRGEKKCDGFHPDYCAEWRQGDTQVQILICLGCSEAKVYGRWKGLYYDLSSSSREQLKTLLNHRWQNRPKSEYTRHSRPSQAAVR